MSCFCIWNPESPRAVSFTGAVFERTGLPPASLAWLDFLSGSNLPAVRDGDLIRIDSPGKNWLVEKALLARGAPLMVNDGYELLDGDLQDDPGRIFATRQHYLGFSDALNAIQRHFHDARWMQHPEDIMTMCDKFVCQAKLSAGGVRTPLLLGVVKGYDDLMGRMDAARVNRVFLKLCHGSSASGIVALERAAGRMQAFSTTKMRDNGSGGTLLYNWRAISRYDSLREICRLVDAVCAHHAMAEQWVPKAGWQGRRFDVRVVVIAGRATHVVARLAEGPFTNLQFGALRASARELHEHLGQSRYDALCGQAEHAMSCFPRSLYGGVDILLDTRQGLPHVLEVNAFGDLLPGVRFEGRDTYAWELDHVSTTGA